MDINYSLDYSHSATVLANAAGRALGSIIGKYYSAGGLSHDVYTTLYESMVIPVMDYSSALWGFKEHSKCDVVQHRAMRTFLGVGKFAPLPTLSGDMCWLPPSARHKLDIFRLWLRLHSLPVDRITRKVYEWDMSNARLGKAN